MDSSPSLSSMASHPIMPQVGVAADDRTSEEDVCSICLDAFDSQDNPPTITTCKHAFHLQCILEWSQRSKECPICWQLIVLKDPTSQELLSMIEDERSMRSILTVRHIYEDPEVDHEVEYNDTHFEEEIMTSFGSRRHKQRLSGVGPSVPRADSSIGQEVYTPLEEFHSLSYASSQDNRDSNTNPRVVESESPNGRAIAADMHAFSESVKSKFSAASARYKESFTKSTQGLKEKLLSKNSPVKELSRGVQREMSAGIAKIFERLDPNSKKPSPSP
ncbi:E3 ubiquitin-protein ligase RHF1A [Lactuca sativa]|uniref:RING-type E3 ubiquitin transferase n=1 Tax=Lactuca sativa TaxID=4236 RepID=A0A9R1X7U3_LACSA|nr:E3 ubiquitin-protein ligase RHF1A [Lactuca sativa]KAJ0204100.1 hypothetical protein LSAT_V11C500256080 [Lactuca sativa]